MGPRLAVAAGVLLLAIALAINAPASLLDGHVASATGGRMRIANAAGTIWNGTGDLLLLPHGSERAIAWHIDAWPLAVGDLRGTVVFGGAGRPAAFAYGHGRAALAGFDGDLPMDSLLQIAGVPAAFGDAGGNVSAHVERLVRTSSALEAGLALQWRDASVPAPGFRVALGDVRLDLSGSGAEIGGPIANRGGDVEIVGRVTVGVAGTVRLDATIRPRAGIERDRAEAIASALSLAGAPDGQGGFRLAWPR